MDDENRINYIFGFNGEVEIVTQDVSVTGLEEISELLGDVYIDEMRDRKQQLIRRVYYDDQHSIAAEFVYNRLNGEFVGIRLRKMQYNITQDSSSEPSTPLHCDVSPIKPVR